MGGGGPPSFSLGSHEETLTSLSPAGGAKSLPHFLLVPRKAARSSAAGYYAVQRRGAFEHRSDLQLCITLIARPPVVTGQHHCGAREEPSAPPPVLTVHHNLPAPVADSA